MNNPSEATNDRRLSLIILFAGTLFTSASLMFVLQPLFGKLLLPLLGGSPAVWNTCMVFYQTILFLGYLYAHTISTRFNQHRQIQIHAAVILISFLALPLALPENTVPPTDNNPTFWLLWTLFLAIGLPFFVVSTTAPLVQKWFANIGHHTSHDPYYLYAASNTGSLIALLSYPFLLEPGIGLANQKNYWSIGYLFLSLLIAGCAFVLWKSRQNADIAEDSEPQENLGIYRKLHWLALALVPSSLLLGLTNFISTDIASVPLLWIIPLTLYLLSFVIVFSKWNDQIHPVMVKLQPIVLLPFIAYAFINPADLPYWAYLGLHLLAFFFAVMVCHGELAKNRPHTRYLTTFYLIMSFAGMLGGMFNTFVAPFIFNGIYEYPIMIVAALLLRPGAGITFKKSLLLQIIPPALLIITGLIIYINVDNLLLYFDAIVISLIVLTVFTYFFRALPVAFALLTGAIIFLALGVHGLSSHTIYQERSFFGVLAVRESYLINEQNQYEKYHELFHGTTKHGAQRLAENLANIPLTYYSRPGPMGQLFKTYDNSNNHWNIGIVGLGAGALACYAKPEQNWTLYEIDPLVIDIAKNTDYFSYLKRCSYNTTMSLGDARLSLEKEPDQKFDLLVMDAFSSDSVPTHLLTREALALYFKKLKPNGILAFHITNRHLSLKKVLSIHAEDLHFSALIQEFTPQQDLPLVVATDWVVMAKNPETLVPLSQSRLGHWQKMPLYFDMKPWTDDFTNIVSIWK
ncbi:fused MFS/spermidine synthase [Methylobacter sp. S3L5C]|uniref:fused MFS/spermidine synthase n=1 Tax=Methylobacter sp. S3L5C TaxID=2839024 RepID=UPI001FACA30A|nr:fused MFS/spermidine synthase [Methylobacter sp. S3L5C]UOA08541.1 fused MFS/spermidine synthase [Methylobacter sp. S3L5C]